MREFWKLIKMAAVRPLEGDPARKWWPWIIVPSMLSMFWYRGPYGWARERYWRVQFWRHRGDEDSEYWNPVLYDKVTTCANRRATVVSRDIPNRSVGIQYQDGAFDKASFTTCLHPGWDVSDDG